MMDKNYFAPVAKGAAKKNALIRAYPDGTYRVTCFSRPTYTANGLERSDKEEAAERRRKLKALHGGAEKSDTPRSASTLWIITSEKRNTSESTAKKMASRKAIAPRGKSDSFPIIRRFRSVPSGLCWRKAAPSD